jgi:hypothetical protein
MLLLTSKAAGARGAGTYGGPGPGGIASAVRGASGPRSRDAGVYCVRTHKGHIERIGLGDPDDWVMRGVIEAWQR